jgi:hypothetical protein
VQKTKISVKLIKWRDDSDEEITILVRHNDWCAYLGWMWDK